MDDPSDDIVSCEIPKCYLCIESYSLVYFKHLHTITSSLVPFQSIEDPILTIPFGLLLFDTVKEVNLYTHKCGAFGFKV